jgi:DNA invertase Pin-like site-specific DNA recombinase
VTGAHSGRRQLLDMLKQLTAGDLVTVTRIDRLARSTFDLFAIVTPRRNSGHSRSPGPTRAPAPAD